VAFLAAGLALGRERLLVPAAGKQLRKQGLIFGLIE
jgi:hypothetical protein